MMMCQTVCAQNFPEMFFSPLKNSGMWEGAGSSPQPIGLLQLRSIRRPVSSVVCVSFLVSAWVRRTFARISLAVAAQLMGLAPEVQE